MQKIFYDIETLEDGTMTVAVTWDEDNEFRTWYNADRLKLVDELLSFDYIIGFCIKTFDNPIIAAKNGNAFLKLNEKSIDLMDAVHSKVGFPIKLQNLVSNTINDRKTGNGELAIKWWHEGKYEQVVEYCKQDVLVTRDLYYYGIEHGEVCYEYMGAKRRISVNWHNPTCGMGTDFSFQQEEDDEEFSFLDKENKEFFQAFDLVKSSNRIFYLTGKAGTGKTTFLKYLKKKINKNVVVVAFTGVAALNAGGVTVNSFFQIPIGPFIPNDPRLRKRIPGNSTDDTTIYNTFIYSSEKRKILKNLEVLIIDEVSMLRSDLLDVIDILLRTFNGKRPTQPFGGVQVVLIGDTFQLPPIEGTDWEILRRFYDSPFFFSSNVFKNNPPLYLELKTIYRQKELEFIDLLNRIRINQPTDSDMKTLNSRVIRISDDFYEKNYITLCTINDTVNRINSTRLELINQPVFSYTASIEGQFPDKSFPTSVELQLKVGAQIMLLKNSAHYFNGKIAKVHHLSDDSIQILLDNSGEPIDLQPVTWKNIKYTYDEKKHKIEEDVIGSFTQYPLKLAWAVTVHKSQGLTFEKVIADIGNSFTAGQVYVALSRCVTFNGLVLSSQIPRSAIKTHPKVLEFAKNITPDTLIIDAINKGKADELYEKCRNSLKSDDFENAYQLLLAALKYRNDIESPIFERYVKYYFDRFQSNKIFLKKSALQSIDLMDKINELVENNESLENKITQKEKTLNKKNIEISNIQSVLTAKSKEIDNLNNKISDLNKTLSNRDVSHKKKIKELEEEFSRIQNISWWGKLKGKK